MQSLRKPDPNEVPLSAAEVRFAVRQKIIAKPYPGFVDTDPEDEPDDWPVQRVVKPVGTWGIQSRGLRHAQPWDGLAV